MKEVETVGGGQVIQGEIVFLRNEQTYMKNLSSVPKYQAKHVQGVLG